MGEAALARFGADYAQHRAAEGRDYSGEALASLPYLKTGAFAEQWRIRARTFDAFMRRVVRPLAAARGQPLRVLDLGAGNGWLSYRLALEGHSSVALDIRDDVVDGLGAVAPLMRRVPNQIQPIRASFEDVPLASTSVDIAVFNASLHYALDLAAALGEAARVVRPGGCIAILDSPFYRREQDGLAMVAEKKAQAGQRFGERAESLLALPFIEFLTRERLAAASGTPGLTWRRRRVLYPLSYELRSLKARLRGKRTPSRFDLWTASRP